MRPFFEEISHLPKGSKREQLLLIVSLSSWLILLLYSLIEHFYYVVGMQTSYALAYFLQGLLLNIFLVSTYAYSAFRLRRYESHDYHTLLYQVFVAAVLCVLASLMISLFMQYIKNSPLEKNVFLKIVLFHIELGLLVAFLVRAYTKWRRMILYERTKFTDWSMKIFEILLFSSLIEHFFQITTSAQIYIKVAVGFLMFCALILSVNVRWIPILNFKQKIISLIYLLFILLSVVYFLMSISSYFLDEENLVLDELTNSIFFIALIGFVVIYALASFLVLIFNLPTSSVFEKKIREIEALQALSEDILNEESEYRAYHTLLTGALATVHADLAWVQTDKNDFILSHQTPLAIAQRLTELTREAGYKGTDLLKISSRKSKGKDQQPYQSILAMPLRSQNNFLGTLYMASRLNNYFDATAVSMLKTLVSQLSIALHNLRLLIQSRENERLKSEFQIAYQIQQSLLPTKVDLPENFEFFAHSIPAADVGGDYYDVYQVNEFLYALMIADVSGHGVKAAFVMAQMKGIFQSLVPLNSNPKDFLVHANVAISQCMRQHRNMYVTALYCLIDTQSKTLTFARAGHCSALYYVKSENQFLLLEQGGLGLGILRNEKYAQYIDTETRFYHEGDIILLYTDGIIESKNPYTQEEYGNERLLKVFQNNIHLSLSGIYEAIMADIEKFREEIPIEDDCTVLLIKFA
ncbi:MAG: SpoIIE family protein phosphatase [Cytophagales bacterium]|nr:SpoIIE family protein phosphatase [Cytophagales bacterium]MDW8383938.1 SpoIIE family protein phosphatase [Flammeovirgaceae bacterium]